MPEIIIVEGLSYTVSGLRHTASTDLPHFSLKTESMIRDIGMQKRSQIAICQGDGMACRSPTAFPNESRAPTESKYAILTCIHPEGMSERRSFLL